MRHPMLTLAAVAALTLSWLLAGLTSPTPAFADVEHACARKSRSSQGFVKKCASDRNEKENVAPVDGRDVLAQVGALPIATWNYRSDDPAIRHVGPMAQDFYAAFGVGEDGRYIHAVDASGVALAAIQGLYRVVQEKDAQVAGLERQNAALEARLAAVEEAATARSGSAGPPAGPSQLAWPVLGALVLAGLVLHRRRGETSAR
jgi:MYXO-CTERM domain-containing protein